MNYKSLVVALLLSLSTIVISANSSENAVLQVTPNETYTHLNESFEITISVINVTNLNNIQIALTFNPTILFCRNVTVPSNNIFGTGSDVFISESLIDNNKGLIVQFIGYYGTRSVNGSGPLMLLEFQSIQIGKSYLNFTYTASQGIAFNSTYLCDPYNNPIQFTAINGSVNVGPPSNLSPNFFDATKSGRVYTIAIFSNSSISAFNYNETTDRISFKATGPDGTSGLCYVMIPRELLNTSYFTVRVDNTPTSSTTSQNATHSFIYFNYRHSTRTILIIPITSNGDLNNDFKVNIIDVAIVARAFGSYPGHALWNPIADINYDDKVDIWDISYVARLFGTVY